jgi:hypothetical protein
LDRYEFEIDERKIDWRIEQLRVAVVRLRQYKEERAETISDLKHLKTKYKGLALGRHKERVKWQEKRVVAAREALQATKDKSGDPSALSRWEMSWYEESEHSGGVS